MTTGPLALSARLRRMLYCALWAAPMPAWQLVFFAAPFALLAALSFWSVRNFRLVPDVSTAAWTWMLTTGYVWDTLLRTLAYAGAAAALVTLLAFPAALAIAFVLRPRPRAAVLALLVVPFFTSYLVRVYSWQTFLADNGIVNALLRPLGLDVAGMLNSPFAMMVGYATLCLPLVVILQSMSLLAIDRTLIHAAHNLRCGPLRSVSAVIVPAARPGIVVGAVFAFILCFGDFVTPLYLGGGKHPTLAILIADTVKAGQQWPRAAVVALVMMAVLLATALAALSFAYRRRGS